MAERFGVLDGKHATLKICPGGTLRHTSKDQFKATRLAFLKF